MTTQTREDVAKILGKVKVDCPSVINAHSVIQEGEVLIGRWLGTAKYMGARAQARIKAAYPMSTRVVQVARGHKLGEDLFAVYGKAI